MQSGLDFLEVAGLQFLDLPSGFGNYLVHLCETTRNLRTHVNYQVIIFNICCCGLSCFLVAHRETLLDLSSFHLSVTFRQNSEKKNIGYWR